MSDYSGTAALSASPAQDAGDTPVAAGASPARRPSAPEVTVLIAMHNEAGNVAPLLREIAATFDRQVAYEIVVVDDASTDATAGELAAAEQTWPQLRALRHDRRCGQTSALWTGAWAARAPLLLTMDGDCQNDPADALRLLRLYQARAAADRQLALVAGQRTGRKAGPVKKLSSQLANAIRRAVLGDRTRDTGCGLKAIDRQVFLALPFFAGLHRFLPALVQAQGYTIAHADVDDRPRVSGTTKYGFWNRALVGLGDLLAVWWLIRRARRPGATVEVSPARTERVVQV